MANSSFPVTDLHFNYFFYFCIELEKIEPSNVLGKKPCVLSLKVACHVSSQATASL